ncbi:MAG: tyrosine-protein phosphatase, partial [Bacillales bacterium]|nr:tyrosine-protein phosphatase [Bacillales bacterium]
KYEDRIVKSMIFDFHTADLPRTVQIEGVSNTRDMGGYYTADGKYQVKEGMIYRGGKLEDITEAGRTQMLDVLGIQTDLDVRGDASSGSPLGANVNYVNLKGPYYKALIMDSTYQKALANEIKVFADENNYPVYFHCSLGRDRTGTLAFLLNAMLGVGELDLFMDYELSWFATTAYLDTNIARNMIKGDFQAMYDYIDNYGAGTVAENAEQFMLDIGVTQTEINSIKSIMLRDVTHTNANETASLIVKAIETDAVHEEKENENSDTIITKENG